MIPFNFSVWEKDKTKKLVTRGGSKCEIVSWGGSMENGKSVEAAVEVDGKKYTLDFFSDGRFRPFCQSAFDIFFDDVDDTVALDTEIGHWLDKLDDKYCQLTNSYTIDDIKETARHFYELGKKMK